MTPVMYIDPNRNVWWNPFTWSKEAQIIASIALIIVGIILIVASGGSLAAVVSPYLTQFVGTVLLSTGGASLVGGYTAERQYGDFNCGWNSGTITGFVSGVGFGFAGLAFTAGNIGAGLMASSLFPAAGALLGTEYK